MYGFNDLYNLISPHYPELVERIRQLIEDSEKSYSQENEGEGEAFDSFLWEHTVHVAAIAQRIARVENVNVIDAVIAALFHDSGKFLKGRYHDDEKPEEESAAELAQKILTEEGMNIADIETITKAIIALYSETIPPSNITDVVHDADFLAKFGYLGVANLFMKSGLRGMPLHKTLISSLSKELTYAAALEANMRTGIGKTMAKKKSVGTLSFYRGLLKELREAGIAFFVIKKKLFPRPESPGETITLLMVVPENCPECQSELRMDFSAEAKTKCQQLTAEITCAHCPNTYRVAFCLPEIPR